MKETYAQWRRFSTDAYGLERLFRFVQATLVVLATISMDQVTVPARHSIFEPANTRRSLIELSTRLGLVRRCFRVFRFFDSFTSAFRIFTALHAMTRTIEMKGPPSQDLLGRYLDGLAALFNGFYLLLEAVTLVDASGVSGLAILGHRAEHVLKLESQRFWFLALAAGALACAVRLTESQSGIQAKTRGRGTKQAIPEQGKEGTRVVQLEKANKQRQQQLLRKMAACLLDMALPGSVLGWVSASKCSVGSIMMLTSYLTGVDVWERCGREVRLG